MCRAPAEVAGTVTAMQVVRALAGPLARARPMTMERPATRTSHRTEKTIGLGGRFQQKLVAALHTRGVSSQTRVACQAGCCVFEVT